MLPHGRCQGREQRQGSQNPNYPLHWKLLLPQVVCTLLTLPRRSHTWAGQLHKLSRETNSIHTPRVRYMPHTTCMHTQCIYLYVTTWMCVCVITYLHIMCVYVYLYVYIYLYVCTHVYIHKCVCVCVYICVYISPLCIGRPP